MSTPKSNPTAAVAAAVVRRGERNGTEIEPAQAAKVARHELDTFLLEHGMDGTSRALSGSGLDPTAFLRAVTTVTLTSSMKISTNQQVAGQQYRSVLVAAMNIATLGLHPAPQLGQAWLVPFWDSKLQAHKMQLIVGYQGFVTLAGRAGWSLKVQPIYAGQDHRIDLFNPESCFLKPLGRTPDPDERPELMAFIARSSVLGVHQVDAKAYGWYLNARERSESWQRDQKNAREGKKFRPGPWTTDELAMVSKTVVRWERKTVPMHDPTTLAAARLAFAFTADGSVGGDGELPPTNPMEALLWAPDRYDTDEPGEAALRVSDLSDGAIMAELAGYAGGGDCNGRDISGDIDGLVASFGHDPVKVVPIMVGDADGPTPPRELLVAALEMCRRACTEIAQ